MKATVLEIKKGYAALLQEDGSVVQIKSNKLRIGDVVSMKEPFAQKKRKLSTMMAAAVIFVMLLAGSSYAYATPSYYVSLDVNPGIVMQVNMFHRVIGMEGVNEEANQVMVRLNLRNRNIQDAICMAVERIDDLGYFEGESGNILIGCSSKNEESAERLAGKLKNAVEEIIAENGIKAEVSAGAIGYEMVQAAKAIEGMTPGKYNIIVNLLGEDPNDFIETPMSEIMKEYMASKGIERQEQERERNTERNQQFEEENCDPEENEGFKEQNTEQNAYQSANQERNGDIDTGENKSPNSGGTETNDSGSGQGNK